MEWSSNHTRGGIKLFTDASGGIKCGDWCGNQWLQYKWPQISSLETYLSPKRGPSSGIGMCSVGEQWSGQTVQAYCDNEAAVSVLNSGYPQDPQIMHLLRCLFL